MCQRQAIILTAQSAQQNTGSGEVGQVKTKPEEEEKKKTSISKPKGWGPGPKGTMQTVQVHHGSEMGKDGDLSRKGLRNQ